MEILKEEDIQHKAIILKVNRNWDKNFATLYETVRFAWGVKKSRAEQAEIVFASFHCEIVGVFKPVKWLPAKCFPERVVTDNSKRYGFEGKEACPKIQNLYVGKSLSKELRNRRSFCYKPKRLWRARG